MGVWGPFGVRFLSLLEALGPILGHLQHKLGLSMPNLSQFYLI